MKWYFLPALVVGSRLTVAQQPEDVIMYDTLPAIADLPDNWDDDNSEAKREWSMHIECPGMELPSAGDRSAVRRIASRCVLALLRYGFKNAREELAASTLIAEADAFGREKQDPVVLLFDSLSEFAAELQAMLLFAVLMAWKYWSTVRKSNLAPIVDKAQGRQVGPRDNERSVVAAAISGVSSTASRRNITRTIVNAVSVEELTVVVTRHEAVMDEHNMAACIYRAGRLLRGWRDGRGRSQYHERMALVVHPKWQSMVQRMVPLVQDMTCQSLSNTLWGLGALQWNADTRLMDILTEQAVTNMQSFNVQDLVTSSWGLAQLGCGSSSFWAATCKRSEELVSDLTPKFVSLLVWSLATAKCFHGRIHDVLCTRASEIIDQCNGLDISNVMWAIHQSGIVHEGYYAAARTVITSRRPKFDQAMRLQVLHAFEAAGWTDDQLISNLTGRWRA
mmetsp:Transcript_58554/g.128411  ORF Transcript_58554/g.128411 Transcript_58554/m.128411 type:complete len:449 (+) Transcript_58554:146-1492(+)